MDLAKVDTALKAQPQDTFRRETTMPRQATDRPDLQVNAQILKPNTGKAEELMKILGMATDTAQNVAGAIQQGQDQKDQAQAGIDFAQGKEDPNRFAKSRAYRDAWQLQGSKSLAIQISEEVTQQATAMLNNTDKPATLQDLDHLFESVVTGHLQGSHVIGPDGKPTGAITPEAQLVLGNALAKLKADLVPQFAKGIAEQKNTKLYNTTFSNMLFERNSGQTIGTPPGAVAAPDPLAPLPGSAPQKAASVVQFGDPTGHLPIAGAVTSSYAAHLARGSHGVDLDGKMGQPITAPAGGKVTVGHDAKSGLFIKIDHGDGVVSSYSHLSKADFKTGDVIQAGQTLGAVGNSGHAVGMNGGDGTHLHYRIKVDGKDVNPLTYSFKGGGHGVVVADGSEPTLETQTAAAQAQLKPGFDVEAFMSSLPPSVDKGQAKSWLMDNLIAQAASTKDTSLLNGIENSKRKDGFPSFTADERLKLTETRDRLEEANRVEADRVEREMQKDNALKVLQATVDGHPPSPSWIAEQSRNNLLSPEFALSRITNAEEQAKADAREARTEARADQADTDNTLDAYSLGIVAKHSAGDLSGPSWDKLLASGALGPPNSKKAAARALRIQAAEKVGQKMMESDPQFAQFSHLIQQNFKPRKMTDGPLLLMKPQSNVDESTYAAMMASFKQLVEKGGKSPDDAYNIVVKQYAPSGGKKDPLSQLADIRKQMDAFRAKKAAAGR